MAKKYLGSSSGSVPGAVPGSGLGQNRYLLLNAVRNHHLFSYLEEKYVLMHVS